MGQTMGACVAVWCVCVWRRCAEGRYKLCRAVEERSGQRHIPLLPPAPGPQPQQAARVLHPPYPRAIPIKASKLRHPAS